MDIVRERIEPKPFHFIKHRRFAVLHLRPIDKHFEIEYDPVRLFPVLNTHDVAESEKLGLKDIGAIFFFYLFA